jgi:uncharacterized protein (TIGR03067 family)
MRVVVMIAVFAVAVAVPDREDPSKKDVKPLQEQLQGEWQLFKASAGGRGEDPQKVDGTILVVKNKNMAIREAGRGKAEDVAFTLDETKKPVAIDLMPGHGDPQNGREKVLGIIQIDGDTLTICFPKGGGAIRPREFASPPNSEISVLQFRRTRK